MKIEEGPRTAASTSEDREPRRGSNTVRVFFRRFSNGLLLAILLNAGLSFVLWKGARSQAAASDWVSHTQAVRASLETLLRHLLDMETGGRGYALTGKGVFLDPYGPGRIAALQNLALVRHLTADNPSQQRRLDALEPEVNADLALLDELVAARRASGAPPLAGRLEYGKRLMDQVRGVIQEMEAEEDVLLNQRILNAQQSRQAVALLLWIGGLLNIFFLAAQREQLLRNEKARAADRIAAEVERAEEIERRSQYLLGLRDQFLSHVAHELRSPLSSVCSFSEIIADRLAGPTTSEQDQYLKIILNNTGQLKSMIEDLLLLRASQTGKLTIEAGAASLEQAIVDAINSTVASAKLKGVELCSSVALGLPAVCADPIRLQQVLIILCDNAIKFTPQGGQVRVRAAVFERAPNLLVAEVSDTGCGIPPGDAERIFEHLYQVEGANAASRKGLGLGLHIAKELVTRQNGRIWVESKEGHGSTFSFTIPTLNRRRGDKKLSPN